MKLWICKRPIKRAQFIILIADICMYKCILGSQLLDHRLCTGSFGVWEPNRKMMPSERVL